jgi:regulator of extracellular matrix RemA (YlzA/DUF370 family)
MTPQFVHAIVTYGPRYVKDLNLDVLKVAGMYGNWGVECDQFRALQEYKPTVAGSRGGWGPPQWTGPRRRAFEAWADSHGFKRDDPEAFYLYTLIELRGPEKAALAALRKTKTLDTATTVFMEKFERPGVEHLAVRKKHALDALHILETAMSSTAAPVAGTAPFVNVDFTSPAQPTIAQPPLPAFEVNAVRDRLVALGYSVAGLPDGVWGDRMVAAIKTLQETAAKRVPGVVIDGVYGDQTKALLADDANHAVVSPLRASVTADQLATIGTPGVVGGRKITLASVLSAGSAVAAFVVALQAGWTAHPELPWYATTVMGFLPPWAPPLVIIAANLYSVAKSQGLVTQAVERVRQGIDNTGLPATKTAPAALPFGLDKLHL